MAAKYEAVLESLSARIERMTAGERLPTEQQLASDFGVSNMTVRRAIEVLSNAKRIVGVPGRGLFVARPAVVKQMTLASFTDSMRAAGLTARAKVLSMAQRRSTKEEAEELEIPAGDAVYFIERLRFGGDVPLSIDRSLLPAHLFPGLLGVDLTGSLYEILARKYDTQLSRAESRVSAVLPSQDDADLLTIDATTPCIRVVAKGATADVGVVERTTSLYRGDRYELLISPAS